MKSRNAHTGRCGSVYTSMEVYLFLIVPEIIQLTGKKRRASQIQVLRFMGIEHKIRPDGSLLVSRTHVEKLLDGESVNNRIKRRTEPDWSIFNAQKT